MHTNNAYVSYGDYFLDYNTSDFIMKIGKGKNYVTAKVQSDFLEDFEKCEISYTLENTGIVKKVCYTKGEEHLSLVLRADADGISVGCDPDGKPAFVSAVFDFADACDMLSMRLEKRSSALNCALGNAVSRCDNAVFDKGTDSAVVIDSKNAFIGYDKKKNAYTLEGKADFRFNVVENVYSSKYHVPYGRMNKNNTFGNLPPVGWMSWYAVKFDASEKTVLENADFQSKYLKDYGANTIWVDWEWYHKGFYVVSDWVHTEFYEEHPRDDGVDTFHPDKEKYPNGLKVVSDKIKDLGLIPSLWIGFTHETWETDYIKEHPEIVLTAEPTWVGIYFYDITHPTYLNDFLPKALANVKNWGYDAVKFDTLPICMEMTEKYHDRLYDKSLTTYQAYRNMIAKTREILGKDMYMLSCSGDNRCDVLWGADIFDGARIGLDIFKWDEFIKNCVMRTMEFYPLHNVMMYNDPDNVVVREEFNTYNQAVSRAVFVSMLGMPVTFGDNLPDLPEDRVNILRRVIPALDISPKDISARVERPDVLVTNLNINKDWEDYNVVSVFNTTETAQKYSLSLENDAELYGEGYHIYDFWHDEYLGYVTDGVELTLEPCETRVLAVRAGKEHPQILSTNRHITQGAAEIINVSYADMTISLECNLVKDDMYKAAVYLPTGYKIADADKFDFAVKGNVAEFTFTPDKTAKYDFKIKFKI